jgi:hypothetical protein
MTGTKERTLEQEVDRLVYAADSLSREASELVDKVGDIEKRVGKKLTAEAESEMDRLRNLAQSNEDALLRCNRENMRLRKELEALRAKAGA